MKRLPLLAPCLLLPVAASLSNALIACPVAQQSGAELVDVYAAFEAYEAEPGRAVDDLLLDGMHPNQKGYQLIAGLFRQQLEATAHKPAATGRFKPIDRLVFCAPARTERCARERDALFWHYSHY